jgi:hypothetical protein
MDNDNGKEITEYIRLTRTPEGRCKGTIQVLANEDGVQPFSMSITRDNATDVLAAFKKLDSWIGVK